MNEDEEYIKTLTKENEELALARDVLKKEVEELEKDIVLFHDTASDRESVYMVGSNGSVSYTNSNVINTGSGNSLDLEKVEKMVNIIEEYESLDSFWKRIKFIFKKLW